jgi:hypothetical protein
MLPEYPRFKFVEFSDLPFISKHLKNYPCDICELNLVNIFIWENFDHPQLTLINQNLCIYVSPANEPPSFLEPVGSRKISATVDICLKHAGKMSRISSGFIAKLPKEKYKISEIRNQFDYIYETKVLAELRGRKFDGKRNHIKKFKQRHPEYKFVRLTSEHKNEALNLFKEWFAIRKESRFFPKLAYTSQNSAIEKAFSHFNKLNLMGGALYIDKSMKGFTLGSFLNPEMISVHFLYGHPALQGISQILLWEACRKTYASSKYLNLEQDLGIPGLRKAKLSNQPLRLQKKYEILPNPRGSKGT